MMQVTALARNIQRATEQVLDRVVEDLQDVVRIPSINPAFPDGPGEGGMQSWIAGVLDSLDCEVETIEPDPNRLAESHPAIKPFLSRPFTGRPNVIGWIGGTDRPPAAGREGDRRAHLLLNSHVDTVAPGDAGAWSVPPFSAKISDGWMYGLGVADAKGCLVTFLGALRALSAAGLRLDRSLMIQSVVDEESGGAGTLDLILRGYTATAAVVGEPTGLRVCPASRGMVELHIEAYGRKAHPGEGWRGVNAVYLAWRYVAALERLREELDRTAMHPLWRPLRAGHVWNLMALNTGPSIRAVPDRCRLEYSIGLIGTEAVEEIRAKVEAELAAVAESDPWLREHPPSVTWSDRVIEPAIAAADHAAVRTMVEAGRALGEEARVEALSAATDGRFLSNTARVPAINFGPGEMFRGHSPDERLSLDELRRGVAWMALFIAGYCGVASGPTA